MAKDVVINGDEIVVSEQPSVDEMTRYSFINADQAEKHLATFAEHTNKLRAGDITAIKDAASEFRKSPEGKAYLDKLKRLRR